MSPLTTANALVRCVCSAGTVARGGHNALMLTSCSKLQWACHVTSPLKRAPTRGGIWFLWPIWVSPQNGISIGSAVFAQLTRLPNMQWATSAAIGCIYALHNTMSNKLIFCGLKLMLGSHKDRKAHQNCTILSMTFLWDTANVHSAIMHCTVCHKTLKTPDHVKLVRLSNRSEQTTPKANEQTHDEHRKIRHSKYHA